MTSFAQDIAPLFRERDVKSMQKMFDLSDYEDVRDNATAILETVTDGSMPCDTAWPKESTELFRTWMQEGFPA